MSVAAISYAPALAQKRKSLGFASSSAGLRFLLFAGCLASVVLAAWAGEPARYLRADPELAFLLRGMAAIKAVIVLAALGVLSWRFGHTVSQRMAAGYLMGAWLTAGATVLVWQLSFIPLAALVFHAGEFTLLFVAWRDHQDKTSLAK